MPGRTGRAVGAAVFPPESPFGRGNALGVCAFRGRFGGWAPAVPPCRRRAGRGPASRHKAGGRGGPRRGRGQKQGRAPSARLPEGALPLWRGSSAVGAVLLQRPGDVAVDEDAQAADNGLGLVLHPAADPVQEDAHEGVLVEVGDEALVLLPHRQAGGLLLHHPDEQVVGHLVEVALHLLPADGVVGVHNEGLVGQGHLKNLQKPLLPGVVGLLAADGRLCLRQEDPLHQVVDVLKVVVEGLAADPAVLGDVGDGDLVQRLLQQQLLQRGGQRQLGGL